MSFLSPFLRNPITDFTGPLMSAQTGLRCADFEMRLMNCFEAYGYPKGIEKCEAYYDDFKECCTRDKQVHTCELQYYSYMPILSHKISFTYQ